MSWWNRLLPSGRKGYTSLDLLKELYGGRLSNAGKAVNVQTALELATVLCIVRVLCDGVAQVPFKLLRKTGRQIESATDHSLYWILHRRPNPWQTSFEYRETFMMHAVLCGNHFSFINRVRGQIVELIPFEPGQITVKRSDDYRLTYEYVAKNGTRQVFPQEAIWHFRGPSWNSWMGMEAVQLARDAIGLSMAIEEQQAGLYKNGANTTGIYSVEGNLTDDQYAKLAKFIKENYEGPSNAGKTMILDRAAKFISRTMSGVDAQTLESRRHQVEDVCRPFRVMPIMVGHADKAMTYASAEQMFLAHLVHTLSPWYQRIEQSVDVNLLTEADSKAGVYAKLFEKGLLRGAMKDTAAYLNVLTTVGIMTRNEAREKLDLNPLDGLDEPLTPANIVGANTEPDDPNDKRPNEDA